MSRALCAALERPSARIFKDQSALDLRLHLLRGPLGPGPFDVLASGTIERGGLTLEARIIGASHWLTIGLGSVAEPLHEVFACEGAEPGRGGRRLETPMSAPPLQFADRVEPGLEYVFESRVDEGARAARDLGCLAERIDASGQDQVGLRCEFPSALTPPNARVAASPPCTLLLARFDEGPDASIPPALRIETAHSYPGEGRVVFSRTSVQAPVLGKRGGRPC